MKTIKKLKILNTIKHNFIYTESTVDDYLSI